MTGTSQVIIDAKRDAEFLIKLANEIERNGQRMFGFRQIIERLNLISDRLNNTEMLINDVYEAGVNSVELPDEE